MKNRILEMLNLPEDTSIEIVRSTYKKTQRKNYNIYLTNELKDEWNIYNNKYLYNKNLLLSEKISSKDNIVFLYKIIAAFIFTIISYYILVDAGMPKYEFTIFPNNVVFFYLFGTPWGFVASSAFIKWQNFNKIPFLGLSLFIVAKISISMFTGFWFAILDIAKRIQVYIARHKIKKMKRTMRN